jgi:hypothetical protein
MNGEQHDTNDMAWSAPAITMEERSKRAEKPAGNGSDPLADSGPHEMAARICNAFNELIETNSGVIVRFYEAFLDRSKVASLRESHPKFGLAYALTHLLWQSPTDACFCFDRTTGREAVRLAPSVVSEFRSAVSCVADKYPRVLRMMMENKRRCPEISFPVFLGGLLTLYAENVSVSPH